MDYSGIREALFLFRSYGYLFNLFVLFYHLMYFNATPVQLPHTNPVPAGDYFRGNLISK
jgi:hypothetical protein